MMDITKREQVAFFEDPAGNMVAVGDRVAVAVACLHAAMRLGEVLEITGCFYDSKWRDIRVKVRVTVKRGRYNPDARQLEDSSYIRTYDAVSRVVKVD